jgi:hypothetical protein
MRCPPLLGLVLLVALPAQDLPGIGPYGVAGTVLEADGAPAAGVTVSVHWVARTGPDSLDRRTMSSEYGHFAIDLPGPGRVLVVAGRGPPELPVHRIVDAGDQDLIVALPGEVRVSGVVLDPSGHPVRALLTVHHTGSPVERTASTDGDGRFSLASVPPGRLELTARRDGCLPSLPLVRQVVPGEEIPDLRLHLRAGEVLAGVVQDPDGNPVPRVTVRALTEEQQRYASALRRGRTDLESLGLVPRGSTTDRDGAFRITGLPSGQRYPLLAVAEGWYQTEDEYPARRFTAGATDIVLVVRRTGEQLEPGRYTVLGVVQLEAGAQGEVTIRSLHRKERGRRQSVSVPSDGCRFTLQDIAADLVAVSFDADGHAGQQVPVLLPARGWTIDLGTITLTASGAQVAGRVVDHLGGAVVDARVTLEGLDATAASSDAAGYFRLAPVPDETYAGLVRHPDHPTAHFRCEVRNGVGPTDLLVQLEAAGWLAGTVTHPDGTPATGVLRASMEEHRGYLFIGHATRLGPDGSFRIRVRPGRYRVTYGDTAERVVDVTEGRTTLCDLVAGD